VTLQGVEDAPQGGDVELARDADAEPTRKKDFDRLGRRWPLGAGAVTVEERGNRESSPVFRPRTSGIGPRFEHAMGRSGAMASRMILGMFSQEDANTNASALR
jgi:hypothetical protein